MGEKSNMSADWIQRTWAANPCELLSNGNVRTGPVRLAFANILQPGKPRRGDDGKEKPASYGATLLFPEGVDLTLLQRTIVDLIKENAPAALTNQVLADKLNKPLKKQENWTDGDGEMYDGFVPGRWAINANSNQQPPCVDQRMAPITEMSRVYSGCWAIVTIVPKWFDVGTNKGPTFYLQSVMVVADDENLGGVGSANPNIDFAGVKIDQAVNPSALFGAEGHTAGGGAPTGGVDLFS